MHVCTRTHITRTMAADRLSNRAAELLNVCQREKQLREFSEDAAAAALQTAAANTTQLLCSHDSSSGEIRTRFQDPHAHLGAA